MPDYEVRFDTVTVGGLDYRIRSLLDLQQYSDPLGEAERAGISSASWPLFGHLWPSGRVLAALMHSYDLEGKRILEIGAGLALTSLVIHRRAGDVTVSDRHPLSRSFLRVNLRLNNLGPLKYQEGNWASEDPGVGRFDLILGSDVLYERQQPRQLARFIAAHAAPSARIIIVDPGRSNRARFCREMKDLGYGFKSRQADPRLENGVPFKGSILTFAS